MAYRLVQVKELADYGLIVHMGRYGAKTVILRHGRHIVLAVVLPQGLSIPCNAFLYIASVKTGLVYNLV